MSEEIGLRVIEQEDLEFIHKLNNNPDIMSYWFEEPYKSMARLQDMYEKSMHNQQERRFILKKNKDRKSTRLNSSHVAISYAVFCLKKKKVTESDTHIHWKYT